MDRSHRRAGAYQQPFLGKRTLPGDDDTPGASPKLSRTGTQATRSGLSTLTERAITHAGVRPAVPSSGAGSAAPRFDFQFIDSDRQLHRILATCMAQQPQADILLITQPDGLTRDNLVSRLRILDDGQHLVQEGRLFDNDGRPLHLVLDLRQMTGEDIAAFNDLLDPVQPMLYHKPTRCKAPLGPQVSIRVLTTRDQIPGNNNSSAPGGDFWRRINRPGNTWQGPSDTGPSDTGLSDTEGTKPDASSWSPTTPWPGPAGNLPPPVRINLHLSQDWRRLLYGGPGINSYGQICHIPGALETVQAGQSLLLRGDMTDNLELQQHLGQLVHSGLYHANGIRRQLPPDIRFYHEATGQQELTCLSQAVAQLRAVSSLDALPDNLMIVNQANLAHWLNPVGINDKGCSVPNTSLMTGLAQGARLLVTSSLTQGQWFLLLGHLQGLSGKTDSKPEILVPSFMEQPEALALQPASRPTADTAPRPRSLPAVTARLYSDESQLPFWLQEQSPPALCVQINAQTSCSQLFDNLFVRSERPPRFGHYTTALQQALKQGTPVVIQGLHTNPELQQMLESLCTTPPSLTINGRVRFYPDARIQVLWPHGRYCSAPLWTAALALAASITTADFWEICAQRHGMRVADIPRQAIDALYKAFATIAAPQTARCGPLPLLNAPLLDSLITAARQACQADRATDCQPRHWRKAINSVLTHSTRPSPAVRDFMKVICEKLVPDPQPQPWVDVERLALVLQPLKKLDANFVENRFWSLARAFSPGIFATLPLRFDNIDRQTINVMKALVVGHAPLAQRAALELALGPHPEYARYTPLPLRSGSRIKRLQDAMASGWAPVAGLINLTPVIETVANACLSVALDPQGSEAEKCAVIRQQLVRLLHGPGDGPVPLAQLVQDMLHGCQNSPDRHQRRLARLKARLELAPVLFIEGETGTGKSYFSHQLATRSGQAWIATMGPATGERELVHKWVWRQGENGSGRYMERLEQTLLQWAKTQPEPTDDYLTLVLDEANLAQEGILDCLKGLWRHPPCLYVDGQPLVVSTRHRVILTGNPPSYGDRQIDATLLNQLQRLHYPPLEHAFLRDRVVEPALHRHLAVLLAESQLQTAVTHAAGAVLTLWNHYQPLLPDYRFTPRDLVDICAWTGWYLQQHPAGAAVAFLNAGAAFLNAGAAVACLNTLVWQSCQDVLGLSLPEQGEESEYALRCWFCQRYRLDESLLASLKTQTLALTIKYFRTKTGYSHPEFDTSSAAASGLVDCLAQDLMRCQRAFEHNVRHGGRQATLIEGPTGRGKDAILNHLLASYSAQVRERGAVMPDVVALNACDCAWEILAGHIRHAQVHGQILVISEMNLISSAFLEGELNAILAGDAHPGFHLFATINPPDYTGRKPLSPALKGRFRYLPLRSYNLDELERIARRVLSDDLQGARCARQLSNIHCHLRQMLSNKGICLQPTAQDLQELARAAAGTHPLDLPALATLLEQHYQVYLLAAGTGPGALLEEPLPDPLQHADHCDRPLTHWLNSTVDDLDTPWQVRRGRYCSVNPQQHCITLSQELTHQEARCEALHRLAQTQWPESGLPLDPPESDDTLLQALYKRWQQLWYQHRFKSSSAAARKLFALDEIQTATLQLAANRPYVEELTRLVRAMGNVEPLNRPVCWERIKSMTEVPTRRYAKPSHTPCVPAPTHIPEPQPAASPCSAAVPASAAHDSVQETLAPEVLGISTGLDTETNYAANPNATPTLVVRSAFRPLHDDPRMYRQQIRDIDVSEQGELVTVAMGHGEYGVEVVEPGILPAAAQSLSLDAQTQRYGIMRLTVFDETPWLALAGLKPNDQLMGVRIEPESPGAAGPHGNSSPVRFHVTRDRYTGLYRVNIPHARPGESFQVRYLLQLAERRYETQPVRPPLFYDRLYEDRLFNDNLYKDRLDARCSQRMRDTLSLLFSQQTLQSLPSEQRTELEAMLQTDQPESLVESIAKYCRRFSGTSRMQEGENQLLFLLKARQGSCRHRAPAFVALCRYFGIPARVVCSEVHAYGEYSLDHARTWRACDLGGSPANIVTDTPGLPDFKPGISMSQITSFRKLMKNRSEAQRRVVAQALGIDMQKMEQVEKTGGALPSSGSGKLQFHVVDCLWRLGTAEAFLTGVDMLQSRSALDKREVYLLEGFETFPSRLSKCLYSLIASHHYTKACQEALVQLYTQFVEGHQITHERWACGIVSTLSQVLSEFGPDNQPMMPLVREALQRKWLVFTPCQSNHLGEKCFFVLKTLTEISEPKAPAEEALQAWYKNFPGQHYKSGRSHRRSWISCIDSEDCVCLSGPAQSLAPTLMKDLTFKKAGVSWTDEPQGAPDIGRLLTGDPAFKKLGRCLSKNRPLVVTGLPDWDIWREKYDDLLKYYLEANPSCSVFFASDSPDQNRHQARKDAICSAHARVIKHEFLHFLYQLKKDKGCHFVYCWIKSDEMNFFSESDFGHCVPDDFNQLVRATRNYHNGCRDDYSDKLIAQMDVDRLRKALNVPSAHVLRLEKLDEVYREFISNIDKKALSNKVNECIASREDVHTAGLA